MDEVDSGLYERQRHLETSALEEGLSYFRQAQDRRLPSETRTGQAFLRECFDLLATAIRKEQDATLNTRTRPKLRSHDIQLISVDAEKLALITLRTAFNKVLKGKKTPTLARLAREIGTASYLERTLNIECGKERNVQEMLGRRNKNRWNAVRRSREYSERANNDWAIQDRDIRLGLELLNLAIKYVLLKDKPVFEVLGERSAVLKLTEDAAEWLRKLDLQYEQWARPFYLPMIVPPCSWTSNTRGGYLTIKTIEMVKKRRGQLMPPKLESQNQQKVFDSVNLLQKTPWVINKALYKIIATADAQNFYFPGTFSLQEIPLPERLPNNSSADELKRRKAERARIHQHNAVVAANRQLMKLRLKWCGTFLDEKALYLPYQLDSRGRIYPIPQLFHPQADDMGRALLLFRDGKALGSKGAYWLGIHLANLFGYDKVTFSQRYEWLREHEEEILICANDPLNSDRLWLKADRPWCFLAACLEWSAYRLCGHDFPSRIPVSMDGTCNGLQHLSALGRDPLGAKATNLAPNSKPEDIYQQVAMVVQKQIDSDNAAKIPEAAVWSNVNRKLVKRATMTTPYGVTLRGIRDQLIRENLAGSYLGESADLWKSANYMAHVLQSSIAAVIVKGIEIMKWLKAITRQLAKSNRPLKWTLPTGFVAVHEYRTQRERRIVTDQRTLVIYEGDPSLRINIRKQLNAIAPNLIHSLDAAHLMLTVLKLAECGLSHFAMVHDSYGVHACDIDLMNRTLREEFVAIYKGSLLERFFQEQCEANPDLAAYLPGPPGLGSFKIAEVVESDYFFA